MIHNPPWPLISFYLMLFCSLILLKQAFGNRLSLRAAYLAQLTSCLKYLGHMDHFKMSVVTISYSSTWQVFGKYTLCVTLASDLFDSRKLHLPTGTPIVTFKVYLTWIFTRVKRF